MVRQRTETLWSKIERTITEEIAAGTYKPGKQLPTEQEFAQRFGVNRHTVRRAMGKLVEAGLIRVEQGRGSFVQERVRDYRLGRRTRFSTDIDDGNVEIVRRLMGSDETGADLQIAKRLNVPPGSPVVTLRVLGIVGGQPLSIALHHFPRARFPGIAAQFETHGSVTSALKDAGVNDYTRKATYVTARMPTADEARLLEQPNNRPVLQTKAVNVDENGVPVEFGTSVFAADRIQLTIEPDALSE